jgi:hypothetical protein
MKKSNISEGNYSQLSNLDEIRREKKRLRHQIIEKEARIWAHYNRITEPLSFLSGTGDFFSNILKWLPWVQSLRFGFRLIYTLLKKTS